MALELELVRSEPTELKGRAMPAEVQDKLPPTVALAAAYKQRLESEVSRRS